MPIRRLFGLLVCALSLLSVPAVAQTVAFVRSVDDETSVYLEETEAWVRVTDPAADISPTVLDTVPVTVATALSGDSEVLELRETDRDSGVFEGRIKLVRNATPSQAGILETGFTAGPPALFDTLTAQYGAATATAEMQAVLIQILDEHGRPTNSLSNGDWVHVRLEDHVRAGDPELRDTVSVLVQNPDMGDNELLTLTETALRTGVFEGRIRHLTPLSPSGDGVVGGYPLHQILAMYDVPGYPEDAEDSAIVVGSRVEVLGADGRPTILVPESSLLRLRVTNRTVVEYPGVDTVDVVLHSQITGDDETVFLAETGPATGIFEGTVPTTVFGLAQDGDGTLTTGELLGPPHTFDVVQISYTDDFSYSGTVWTSVGTYASETRFTDAEGKDVEVYAAGFSAWVRVEDHNVNQPAVVDTIQATIESLTEGDAETLTLTETGQDTAVFSGSIAVELPPFYGSTQGDGLIHAEEDDTLRVLHGDAMGLTASGDLARVRTSRLQFVDEQGRPVDAVVENGTTRVRLEWPDCYGFPYEGIVCSVVFTSRITGDEEVVQMTETGAGTGVWTGEIWTPFSFDATPHNGVLEISNSGSPEYLADVVTVTAGPNSASVPAVGFTLRFIHADGTDAETFSPGEAVGLRLEDHSLSTQTVTLLIRVFGSPDAEMVQATETGPDTAVYVGTLPSRISASPSPYDGTLDVEIGSRLMVDWSHPLDSREALDEAVVSGTGTTPPEEDSPVTFRDAWGNPAGSYAAGTRAWVRVEDAEANLLPTHYDMVQVTLSATTSGDTETLYLRETTRDSGIFEGSMALETEYFANQGDGRLQSRPGEEIEAVYEDFSDEATIRNSSAEFVDESGAPTGEVLENGVARLRVVGSSPGSTVVVTVDSSRGADQESVTLTETSPGSQIYEGTVQLSFTSTSGGQSGNGELNTTNSGAPDYLGDELTVTYQDAEGTAVTIPSRVQFIDSFGRVVSTFALGERVGVRVEDNSLDDPQVRDQVLVLVHEVGSGDAESVTLIETGYDTNVFEGSIATEDAPVAGGDGALQLAPGQVIEAERQNQHTPDPTVAQATMTGASVLFVDAEGRPAEVYLERTRAYVRVSDTFASGSVTVTLQSFLGGDSEPLTLTETGTSTGVFEGSIPLSPGGGANPDNGYLETGQYAGPPNEYDVLTASYQSVSGTVSGTVGMTGSRTWFIDAYGNETDGYTAGTTAYVRVEDHVADAMPNSYDYAQVTLRSSATGDTETLYLRETTRDSGIFEGSLSMEDNYIASSGDGRLQARAGDQIFAEHEEQSGDGMSSDMAMIRNSSAMFVDENGEPTGEVLENGVARLRVVTASPDSEINVVLRSLYGGEQMGVGLLETFPGSHVYEGTVQLSFVPPGGALPGNGKLETSSSGSPDYLGDVLTLTYQDGEGTAVTIPSRVRFFDSYGRVTTTFAVGERVGVRVEDNNLDDPQVKDQIQVLVREALGGESDSVTLIETGYDTNVFEGSIASEDAAAIPGDGTLQLSPGRVIEAERQNQHTPYPTLAQAVISGASVLFIDAEGQPAEVYFERTRAWVRVSSAFASGYVVVTLQSLLGLDSESLTLIETGPSTGLFEGSIPLSPGGGANPNDGFLTTGQYNGSPYEFDTLTASYQSIAGTVSDTVGMTGSRTWFIDAYGNETDSYTVGTTAYVRVEDHVANSTPGYRDYAQVTLQSSATGDSETLYLRETTRDSGIFEGSMSLETDDHPYNPSPGDGRLQSVPVDRIEAVHEEPSGDGSSSDQAFLRYSSAEFIDESGAPTGEVLENGVARLRVTSASPGSSVDVSVASSRAADQVSVTLNETTPGSKVYEGTVQLSFVPPGGGMANSLLETSNSGSPDYLGDELTLTWQDGEGHAVTIPSRVRFIDSYDRVVTTFAVGEPVGVRVEDNNLDDPQVKDQIQVMVREALGGESDSVTLIETGYDTNVFEGSIASEDAAAVPGDGTLQLSPGRVIEAERQNEHTPYPTLAQAVISGASVLFVDAEGQPAEVYFERTRAWVRVSDTFADFSTSADSIGVTVQSFLGGDSESLSLTETGPSTGVFEGSIPLSPNPAEPGNGILETAQELGTPTELDTLTASYQSIAGTVSDTAGMIGSRAWFIDAYGNLADSYTAGTTAYVRVENHVAGSSPNYYDYAQVTLSAPGTGDSETLYLRETTRDSGIFEGSMSLETEDHPPTPSPGDGRLQSMPGEEIEVVHDEPGSYGSSSDKAVIRFSSAEFIDEAGEPTGEVLENGVARLRVTNSSSGSSVDVSVASSRAADQVSVTLNETSPGSQVYEGTVQLSFVPPGGGMANSLLETSTSGSPDYLGDELTLTWQDGEGRAVTIPSRVRFIDSYGRVATTFAVGERVGVRVEDNNLDDPQARDQIQVLVREALGGESDSVTLTETGYDTNVFEGSIASEDAAAIPGDGTLQLSPGRVIEAERQNEHTPYPTLAQAVISGASVLFVDAEGQPAEIYFEGTRAWVRVSDTFADFSPSPDSIAATVRSFMTADAEIVSLTETGPSTGVFEGSISLSMGSANPGNGILETGRDTGPPTELDTLTASYESIAGTVSDTVGTLGSRTWFIDAYGNLADSYTAGTTAYVRVENHVAASSPNYYDYAQVTLSAPATGDSETLYLRETTRDSGIFEGSLSLEREDHPPTPSPNDGRLQSMPGEEIEVVHAEPAGYGSSSDKAVIRFSSAEFIDEAGAPTGEVLENGVARLRVTSASPGSSVDVSVASSRAADQVSVTLTETSPGSQVYEGTVQLSFVPPGGGMANSLLETSTSGSPDYLGDELTLTYQDGEGHAVTIPSRVRFIDSYGRVTTTFAVGEPVGVRVEDNNLDDPQAKDQIQVLVREALGGEADSVTLIETGYDTNVFEGSIASEDAAAIPGDGTLQLAPGRVIEAERQNEHTPYPTLAQAVISGASVVFVDAEGQPAEIYLEATRAWVRVIDTFADITPSPDSIPATVRSFMTADAEIVSLTETGPSTGVFEGSISLSTDPANPGNGFLETGRETGPPTEFDTLTASYESIAGTVSDTVGTLGSRTWFIDAYGNETDSYTAGTTAYVRVEDHVSASSPNYYDYAQVTLYAPATGDSEAVYLVETTRDSGIFEGPVSLERDDYPPSPVQDDGRLQSAPGEEIEVVHRDPGSSGRSSDKAVIRLSSAEFIDESGAPTGEVPENGVARLRVTSASPGSSVDVSVASSRAADQVSVTLTETSPGSQVYEGTVQLSFVPPGGGMANSLLETSNSGSPDYLGDELTLIYQDGEGHAVTIPSRVRFIDSYGSTTTTFAVGERVGVRVEDNNLDDPQARDQIQVLVRQVGSGDADGVTLTETGYDTNVFEGSIATEDGPVVPGDGTLQVTPGQVIEAERQNQHTPYPTLAQAVISGASVLFVDAEGQPAEVYFERTRAWVRVSDTFASGSIGATVRSFLTADAEIVSLTETGPSTGVFEGSIALATGSANPNNGILETGRELGTPTEFDTLTASYESIAGTVSDTAGTVASRTWFIDMYGNETDRYAAGSTARVRVRDHNFDQPAVNDTVEVTLRSSSTGDEETVTIYQAVGEGVFEGFVPLDREPSPVPNDGSLQSMPGEEIEVVHTDLGGGSSSSDRATIRNSEVLILDPTVDSEGKVLENGTVTIQVADTAGSGSGVVVVRSRYAEDEETLFLPPWGQGAYQGTVQLAFVPPGGATPDNGVLETSNSGSPEYFQDELTASYLDAEGRAVTVPSRIGFLAWAEDWPVTEYAVGSTIRVRMQDQNANDPAQIDTATALVTSPGGDAESITLTETYAASGIFWGLVASSDTPGAPQDGTLTAGPNTQVTVQHLNVYTPVPTTAQVPFNGNFAPDAVADSVETEPGQTVVIDVLANDTDRDNEPLGVAWAWRGAHGSVGIVDNKVDYTPDPGFEGTDTFHYVAGDPRGGQSRGTVTVNVVRSNSAPTANDDFLTMDEDGAPLQFDVVANDTDADNDPLEVTFLSEPPSGTAELQPDGTVLYTPAPNANGDVSFSYQVSDPSNAFDYGLITVTVNPVNDPPAANDDTLQVEEDGNAFVFVLDNDGDIDNDPLDILSVTQGTNGTVTLNEFDDVTYTPNADFHGADSFTYTLSDGNGGTDTATVTVTVTPVEDAPVANDDTAATDEGSSVNVAVLANDTDADNDTLEVTAVTQGTNGSVTLDPVTYTPNANFHGTDSFTYTVSDGNGGSDVGTVTITVNSVNNLPVAVDDTATTDEDSSVSVTVLANDTDADDDTLEVTAVSQGANGSVTLDPVTYTPNANFHGTDSFTYTVSDGNGGTDTATVTVTVTPVNDPPVAVNDSAATDEDTAVTVAVLANDTDLDNATLDIVSTSGVTSGSAVVNANETITFTPAEGFHGTVTFDYSMTDGNGGSDVGTVTITVNPVNDPPIANNDVAATVEDSSVNVSVLANDTDPENDTLDVTAVTQGAHGSVVINPDETVTYTPAANYHGADSFTYTVSDGNGGTDTATVNVTVNGVNDTPAANDDAATVAEDSSAAVNVLGNDTDADNDLLEVTAVTQGTNGSVTLDPVTYTPNANFHGADSFTYTASDGNGGTDTATVTITVTPVNDAPVANDDTASVVEDDSVTVNVLGNDTDVDDDTLTVTAVTQGANGAVTLNPVTYTPSPNFFGTDSFTYTVSDGNGGTDIATVTVTIAPANDNLTANDDSATVTEDGSVTVAVLGNDSDPENDVLSVQSVTQGTNGAVAIVGTQVTYTPNADFHGADSFTYTASDGNGGTDSATVTVTVTPVNDAPVAGDDTASVVEDGSVAVTVLGNDADADDDLLSVTSVTQGAHGTVVINGDDTVTYTPEADYNGSDSFTYTVSDGEIGDTATVTVTVGAANDAPVASNDSASTSEDNPVTVSVLGNDTDPENDTLTVSAVTQGTNGSVTLNPVTYTPNANFHGTDSFTYTVSDGNGGTDTATVNVTVNPVNDAPVANDDAASVAEDGSVTVSVLANDTDADNNTLTVTAVTQGAHGTVTINPVTYTPAANYNGADSFTYTISDGNGGTDTATVNVTVGSANDAPAANDDTATVAEDGSVTIPVLANDTDLDNDTLTVISVTQPANGTVTMNPVTYTPNANFFGTNSFTYTVSDGNGGTDTATVNVTVTAVNDAPVAVNDSANTTAELPVTIQVRTNDTDVEGNALTITAVTQGAHGTVTINAGQTVTYTPATAWVGPDSFTYTISDGNGGTATATVNVNVQAPARVSANIQVLYAFNEGSGTTVNDTSGVGTPLNLTVANASAVTWLPGALSINSNTLVQTAGTATKVINASKASNEVTVEAWVDPLNLTQTGPAAIVTISQTHTKRDVTLGQSATAYTGQLRTSTTGQDGTQHTASNVATTNLTHVVYARSSSGAVRIYVNGTQVATGTLTGNLSGWANYNLALGGELSGTRYWRGELHLVAIYSRALTAAEARQNFLAGAN